MNQVARLDCEAWLSPRQLWRELWAIEQSLGRDRSGAAVRYGPRLIDLDLLIFGELELVSPELVIPHPRLASRAFALVPLAEIAANLVIPGLGREAGELLAEISFQIRDNVITQP